MRIATIVLLCACAAFFSHTQATTTFTYQGQLQTNEGAVTDTVDFEFSLYETESGSNQVGTTITRSGVEVEDGLFQVELDFGAGAFDGSPRFLEIAVDNGEPLTPRQPVTAAPVAGYALDAPDTLDGLSCDPDQRVAWNGSDWICADPVDDDTLAELECGADQLTVFDGSQWQCAPMDETGILAELACANSEVPKWDGSAWQCASDQFEAAVWSLDEGDAVFEGGNVGIGGPADPFAKLQVSDDSGSGNGVQVFVEADGYNAVYGSNDVETGWSYGVRGETASASENARGVYGYAREIDGAGQGVTGESRGNQSGAAGVSGIAESTSGEVHGVRGTTPSTHDDAAGVLGVASGGTGYAQGVRGVAENGIAIEARNTGASDYQVGLWATIESDSGEAVQARASAESGPTSGVWGRGNSPDGYGVRGSGEADNGEAIGVYGQTNSPDGYGVYSRDAMRSEGVIEADAGVLHRQRGEPGTGELADGEVMVYNSDGSDDFNAGDLVYAINDGGSILTQTLVEKVNASSLSSSAEPASRPKASLASDRTSDSGRTTRIESLERDNRRKQERIDELQQQVTRQQQRLARLEEVLLEDRRVAEE
ncbi:hypothetical protein [Wenzhouxiangella sp. EGI_FJ10305]|uniref:hypothetical protein n=1 Tax=Wenzhouxiangella sp. EGI_FJ10305 TaxID=3243768 RepID=UPI0035E1A862